MRKTAKNVLVAILAAVMVMSVFAFVACENGGTTSKFTVTFDAQGGSEVAAQTVKSGNAAKAPEAPEKEGYDFLGWYSEAEAGEAWDFATPVEADITLYAHWEEKTTDPGDSSGDQSGDSSGDQSGDSSGDSSGGDPGEEPEGFTVEFVIGEHVSGIIVYETQADTEGFETLQDYSRNKDTGAPVNDGEGQVNFLVLFEEGYMMDTLTVDPTDGYKNLKGPEDTGAANKYRLTKVSKDLTITVTAKEGTPDPIIVPDPFKITFSIGEHVSGIIVYETATATEGTQTLEAYSRNKDTGEATGDGKGQVYFLVLLEEGYVIDAVTASPATGFGNLKGPDETGVENKYNITKVAAELTVSVSAKEAGEEAGIKLYDYFTEELPKIHITTLNGLAIEDRSNINPNEKKGMNGEIPVYDYTDATISVVDCEGYELTDVAAQVKVRGNYTSNYAKKPYRIKFTKKQAMCGLNNGNKLKSWVLLAEWKDPSMLRNSVASYVGNALLESEGIYTTDFRFVELYVNGGYRGVYVLAEQQQINAARVDMPEAEDPADYDLENLTQEEYEALHNVKIGYLIEYDGYYRNEPELQRFTMVYNQLQHANGSTVTPNGGGSTGGSQSGWGGGWGGWNWGNSRSIGFSISNDIYFAEQRDFIQKCTQTIWDVIYDATYGTHTNLASQPYHTMDADGNYIVDTTITTAYDAVAKVVNIKSLINMYILQELCQDMDISWSSFYFSLDMSPTGDRLLTYTAPWDFDSALGNIQGCESYNTLYAMNSDNPWLIVWVNQGWFWKMVNARWLEAVEAGVFTGAVQMIDDTTAAYAEAFARNFDPFPSRSYSTNVERNVNVSTFHSQADAAAYLKTWFNNRVSSMTTLFAQQAAKYN